MASLFSRFGGMGFAQLRGVDPREFSEFAAEFGDVVRSLPFQLPENFLLVIRSMSLVSGVCSSLDPEFNLWDAVEPYAGQLLRDERGDLVRDLAGQAWSTAGVLWRLPQRTDALISRLEEGRLTVDISRIERQLTRFEALARRAVSAILFAGLLVAGVLLPDEGSVTVHGGVAPLIEITGGFVGDLTVRENVRLTSGLHGMSKAEVSRRFDSIIAFAELEDFVDTPYKHLSNGMKVRLAFSVVSQLEEPILLVDEVLAVGDKAFREKCYRRIDELLAEGRTLFFVSHNEKDLRRFCTRGRYLAKGALKLDAPIAEVLDAYNADNPTVR